ncbi:hypothetical protein PMIN06_006431 [Paraphaeosphaeria minitans]
MEDSASISAQLLDRGDRISSFGLPPNMTTAELAIAVNHIMNVWWPQLCRSSRTQKVKDTGIFEEGWYDDNGLLDLQNPAYWKIVNGLGTLYGKVHARYPVDAVHTFRVRWHVQRDGASITMLVEAGLSGEKDYRGKPMMKGFRINGPRGGGGWLDFQMELDRLKAQRDAGHGTANPEDGATAPKMDINTDGATGDQAFSPAQRKDVAQQVDAALTDSAALSDDEHVAAKVGKCIFDQAQDPSIESTGDNALTVAGTADVALGLDASNVPGAAGATLTVSTASLATNTIPDMEEDSDWDFDWVKVGEGDNADDFTVPVATSYVYKKGDAVKPSRGWFGRVFYKTDN